MKIAVVIPTYERIEKLKKCLLSLSNQTYQNFSIYIYCDNNDKETFNYFANSPLNTWTQYEAIKKITVNEKREFVIGSWNKFFSQEFIKSDYDGVAWIVDDVELYPDYLEKCVNAMQQHYPDLDGVIGTSQECPNHPEYTYKVFGQVLLGKKFIERYKEVDYKVCCPDYNHFYQDEEMWSFANKLEKFHFCKDAVLKHYHPGFIKTMLDKTHGIVRQPSIKNHDNATKKLRIQKGYLWGQNFGLVNTK